MTQAADSRVLFRVAAGPRLGYGHLVRASALADTMNTGRCLSLRGSAQSGTVARRLGWTLVPGTQGVALGRTVPALLVIDDPSAVAATAWRRAAHALGIPVASIHDLGHAYCGSDLTIDGSLVRPMGTATGKNLVGAPHLILAPSSERWREPNRPTVLIALGGGPRRVVASRLARAVRAARPDVEVRIAPGLTTAGSARRIPGVVWLGPQAGLAREFAHATVAAVGGGVSLYEACRVGAPAVGIAVVRAQRPTITGVAARGAAVDGGTATELAAAVTQVLALLDDAPRRRRLSRAGRRLIDGRGTWRVARALRVLMANRRGD
jgi:spore coat polysaccharide biosynthesis predicted glycosyltransferase SpsG